MISWRERREEQIFELNQHVIKGREWGAGVLLLYQQVETRIVVYEKDVASMLCRQIGV